MWLFSRHKLELPSPEAALPGRAEPILKPGRHLVLGTPLAPPYPEGSEIAEFALGCFWGEERKFWQMPGVLVTAVGYQGGFTPMQQFFIAWGQFRGDATRPETQRRMIQGDPHPVASFRVIGPISNLSEFQQAFSCKADAPMVRKNQCRVW